MDEKFNKFRTDFIKDNFFYVGSEIQQKEYKDDEKKGVFLTNDDGPTTYYKKDLFELNNEELSLAIKIKSYKLANS